MDLDELDGMEDGPLYTIFSQGAWLKVRDKRREETKMLASMQPPGGPRHRVVRLILKELHKPGEGRESKRGSSKVVDLCDMETRREETSSKKRPWSAVTSFEVRDEKKKMKVDMMPDVTLPQRKIAKYSNLSKHVLPPKLNSTAKSNLKACKVQLRNMSDEEMTLKMEETKEKLREQYEAKAMARSCSKRTAYNHEEERAKVKRTTGGRCMKGKNCSTLAVKKPIGTTLKGKVSSEKQRKCKEDNSRKTLARLLNIEI